VPYSSPHRVWFYFIHRLRCFQDRFKIPKDTKRFIRQVLKNKAERIDSAFVEELKQELRSNSTTLTYTDLGSGELHSRRIQTIFKRSAKSAKDANAIFRLVKHLQPAQSVEIGTSLGLSTLYMSMATNNPISTFEGIEAIADVAKSNIEKALKTNIDVVIGNFDDTLEPFLSKHQNIEFFYVDGNHYYEPTMRYFNWALDSSNRKTMMLFDDINWSAEMQKAWKELRHHPSVVLSLDFFHFGLVFLSDKYGTGHYSVVH